MDCKNAAKQMQEYLDHALPDSAAREIERHVKSCPKCAREFRLLAQLDLALRSEVMEQPPGDLVAAVRGRLLQGAVCSWRDVAMAAASVAVALGLFWLFEHVGASVLADGEPVKGVAQFFHVFEVEETTFDLSLSDVYLSASESYAAVCGCLAQVRTGSAASVVVILLIASALVAIGTNAACFHQARIRQWTATRS